MSHIFFILLIFSIAAGNCKKESNPYNNQDPLAWTEPEKQLITAGSQDTMMRILNYFIQDDSVILRAVSRNVSFTDTVTLNYLKSRMYKSVTNPSSAGVGIAAPQVGINRRLCWVQRWDKGGRTHPFEFYRNIRITALSDTFKWRPDGCLSIPGISDSSLRAVWVSIEYQKTDGSFVNEKIVHEYTAHIFQHEIDHIDGIVYLDRVAKKGKKRMILR